MFKKSIPIIFIGLSVVVAMLVLGWVVFVKMNKPVSVIVVDDGNGEVAVDDISDDADDNTNNNNSEIDVSDWKIYRNEIYGYEIKYPQNWIIGTYEGKHGKGIKKSQGEADWVSLAFYTKDKQKIENYQERLMAGINVTAINKSSDFTVEDYLKDFGYDFNTEVVESGRILRIRGIAETWMNIKEENFKEHKAYIIQPIEEHGYYLYFEYNQNIYEITSLWHKNEVSKKEILEIINTFEFTK